MNIEQLITKFHNRRAKPEGKYRHFALLAPLVKVQDELQLLFEVRSESLKTQPGEICFPGGGMEAGESPQEGAIRETCEELNIAPSHIRMLGPLDYIVTPFHITLHPYLGLLEGLDANQISCNPDEVDHIFTVPLSFFLETPPLTYYLDVQTVPRPDFPFHMIQNGKDYDWKTGKYPVLFYQYGQYVIWGMTARIVHNLVELLQDTHKNL